jgi:hypothetical protein
MCYDCFLHSRITFLAISLAGQKPTFERMSQTENSAPSERQKGAATFQTGTNLIAKRFT